jgi:hypothetical protein
MPTLRSRFCKRRRIATFDSFDWSVRGFSDKWRWTMFRWREKERCSEMEVLQAGGINGATKH